MASGEKKQDLIQALYDAVIHMDETKSAELSNKIIEEGIDAKEALNNGLTAAMNRVGELYASGEYFVPELLLCSDALYAGLEILRPHIKTEESQVKKEIILGTVEGDIHDIGKNLVKIMFEAAGWIVHDLGCDVALSRFVDEYKRIGADVIGMSALMTTSMLAMPRLIEMIRAEDRDVAIMVGGAPLTVEIADSFGADGYADNAGEVVKEADRMLERLGKQRS